MQVSRAGGASLFPGERCVCGQAQASRCPAVSTTLQVYHTNMDHLKRLLIGLTQHDFKALQIIVFVVVLLSNMAATPVFPRSHRQVGHVVSRFCGRPPGVCSPHRPQPDQPVLPRTHTVLHTHTHTLRHLLKKNKNVLSS